MVHSNPSGDSWDGVFGDLVKGLATVTLLKWAIGGIGSAMLILGTLVVSNNLTMTREIAALGNQISRVDERTIDIKDDVARIMQSIERLQNEKYK